MANNDTIELLQDCSAGIKVGVGSISELITHVKSAGLKEALQNSFEAHEKLEYEAGRILSGCNESVRDPSLISRGMSWLKSGASLVINDSDGTIASLISDGCHMGIKSLNTSLNDYPLADEKAKSIAGRIINEEKGLLESVRPYL